MICTESGLVLSLARAKLTELVIYGVQHGMTAACTQGEQKMNSAARGAMHRTKHVLCMLFLVQFCNIPEI